MGYEQFDHCRDGGLGQTELMAPVDAAWLLAHEAIPGLNERLEERYRRFLGSTAIRGMSGAEVSQDASSSSTLLEGLHSAAFGDETSRQMVADNVLTDTVERLYKAGHQTKVNLGVTDGFLGQHSRRVVDIHRNTLEYTNLTPEMLRRSKQELRNVMLFEELWKLGVLETHAAVVFSPSPTRMTQAEKQKFGFFTDTESCSVQLLSAEDSNVTLETAMVAGKTEASAERHDIAAIIKLARERGVTITSTDATDILRHVLLLPKASLPGGVSDVVAAYDQAAGGTFYGQAKPASDYARYAIECQAREAQLGTIVEAITARLIAEAGSFRTPLDAIKRLDKLSEEYCINYAGIDLNIDAAVFGEKAARSIQKSRYLIEHGEHDLALKELEYAKTVAVSGSCPLLKTTESSDSEGENGESGEQTGKKWMKCPFCKASVYADPCAKVLECNGCNAKVVDGRVTSTGHSKENQSNQPKNSLFTPKSLIEQINAVYKEQGIVSFEAEQATTQTEKTKDEPHSTPVPEPVVT